MVEGWSWHDRYLVVHKLRRKGFEFGGAAQFHPHLRQHK